LPICVIACSGELNGGRGVRPRDVRSELPASEETHELYRRIVDWNIELSGLMEAPVRAIVGATHNTELVHLENVAYVLDYVREAVARAGLELVPASYDDVSAALQAAVPVAEAPADAR
jgi:hypothetical protein